MRATFERRRELRRHTVTLLDELGSHPDLIARSLADASVRGIPSNPDGCAIAAYLGAVVGADPRIVSLKVTPWRVLLSTTLGRRPVTVPLNPALQHFIQRFDRCAFPELVHKPSVPEPV